MRCKYCGEELPQKEKICPKCGKNNSNLVMIIVAAVGGVLVALFLCALVYAGVNGFPALVSLGNKILGIQATEPAVTQPSTDGTTPTDGNPNDVTCKGTYTASDEAVLAGKDVVVATMGEHTLTNGQLQIYYWLEVVDFVNYWGAYTSYFGLDYTKPLDQQLNPENGQSWQQYFLKAAIDNWQRDNGLYVEAENAGYVMDEEYQKELDGLYASLQDGATKGGYASVEAMLQSDMGAAASFEGYQYYLQRYYKGNLYYSDHYTDVPVTDQEISDYYEKNKDSLEQTHGVNKESGIITDMQYVLIFPEGATKETIGKQTFDDAAWEAARQKAQAILDKWVAEGATEEGFMALVNEAAKENNTTGAGADYKGLLKYSMSEVDVRHILLVPEGGTKDANNKTVYTEEAWEACRQKAQAMLDEWVAAGAKEADFIELAKANSKDGNAKDGGIYNNVTKGYMVETFDAWIFDPSRQYGDYGLVKTEFGYHLMFFVHGDTGIDSWAFDEERQVGDYALIKTDYGYYVLRFTGSEEGWIRYARQALQQQKMAENVITKYPLEVQWKNILLGYVNLAG